MADANRLIVKVKLEEEGWSGEGWLYTPKGPAFEAADRAYEKAWGRPLLQVGVGGSIPFVALFGRRFSDLAVATGCRLRILSRDPTAIQEHPSVRVFPFYLEHDPPALRGAGDGLRRRLAAYRSRLEILADEISKLATQFILVNKPRAECRIIDGRISTPRGRDVDIVHEMVRFTRKPWNPAAKSGQFASRLPMNYDSGPVIFMILCISPRKGRRILVSTCPLYLDNPCAAKAGTAKSMIVLITALHSVNRSALRIC